MFSSVLISLIPTAVRLAERAFGPKTGETKKRIALDIVNILAAQLASAGKLRGVPSGEELDDLIEGIVRALNDEGLLSEDPSAKPQAVRHVVLRGELTEVA